MTLATLSTAPPRPAPAVAGAVRRVRVIHFSPWAGRLQDGREFLAGLPRLDSGIAGFPLQQMGILEAPEDTTSNKVLPTQGKLCSECGNHTMIRKDGCDFCTACGAVGTCG